MTETTTRHWVDVYVDELMLRADQMRSYGDERGAKMTTLHAEEIRARRSAFDAEIVSIDEASMDSGFHPEVLRRLKREGKWSGRRGDMPRHARSTTTGEMLSLDADAGSIADRINARRASSGRAG